jgi:hypothetical protein
MLVSKFGVTAHGVLMMRIEEGDRVAAVASWD